MILCIAYGGGFQVPTKVPQGKIYNILSFSLDPILYEGMLPNGYITKLK